MTKMTDFLDIHGMVDLQQLPYRIIEIDMQDFPTMTIDEIDFLGSRTHARCLC